MAERRKTAEENGRRRRWRRVVLALAATPLVFWGLGNLWLSTPPGRSWIADRIARATGLQVETGPASWSPWGGFVLRGVRMRLPAEAGLPGGALDVLKVERIVVLPRWSRVLRGHLTPDRIEIVRPDANVPVELLMALAGRHGTGEAPPPPEELPVLAGGPNQENPERPAENEQHEQHPSGGTTGGEGHAAPPGSPKPAELPPTSWLIVRDAHLRVGMGTGRDDGLVLEGIDAEIPLRGKPATGGLTISECRAGRVSLGSIEVPVSWDAPRLIVDHWRPAIAGIRADLSFQAVPQADFPFMLVCSVPEGRAEIGGMESGFHAKARRLAAIARMAGYLRIPASWQGDAGADAEDVEISGNFGRRETPDDSLQFDRCSFRAVLRGSVVRIEDARAVGEALSVLGNGLCFPDGRIEAVARIVLPEDQARSANATLEHLAAPAPAPVPAPASASASASATSSFQAFHPLETPDRWYFDAPITGNLTAPLLLIPNAPPIPLSQFPPF